MIVVDTNVLSYFYLPSDFTPLAVRLLERDSAWIVPPLWRSEFRNVLTLYLRKGLMSFERACAIHAEAERLLAEGVREPDPVEVLRLSLESGCSA